MTLTDPSGNILTEQPGVPFSVACWTCDAGQGLTLEEARLLGWKHIAPNDGPSWNYLGYCPDCQKEGAE